MKKKRHTFTPAISKFTVPNKDQAVVGWVTATAEIDRDRALPVQRAVLISDADLETLRWIRMAVERDHDHDVDMLGPEATGEGLVALALLDRLIGRR